MTYGETARKHRKDAGITISKLSKLTGITPATISNFETGRKSTSLVVIETLADTFGLSIDEYIGHKVVQPRV